ncbi:hypothetical protein ACQEPB_08485 [Novosphingobium fluoreni]|uniref:hypothetical protein n=1 Tax=Novosphingobium fluoreni TaxID=1391222 RepID=UPI003DA12F11
MINLDKAAVVVVAAEANTAVEALISAYVAHLRFSTEAIEGVRRSELPISQCRRLIGQLLRAQMAAADWLKHTEAAISTLHVIHRHSNQAEVDIGCAAPWGNQFFTTGEISKFETHDQ